MSLEDRKALDEAMKDNPLWQHHRRMMEPLICPEFLEPKFDAARKLILDSLEGRSTTVPAAIPMEIPDTDAKKLYFEHDKGESKKDATE